MALQPPPKYTYYSYIGRSALLACSRRSYRTASGPTLRRQCLAALSLGTYVTLPIEGKKVMMILRARTVLRDQGRQAFVKYMARDHAFFWHQCLWHRDLGRREDTSSLRLKQYVPKIWQTHEDSHLAHRERIETSAEAIKSLPSIVNSSNRNGNQ